jgi:hypothetical protein
MVAQGRVGKNSYDDAPIPLQNNINKILEYQAKGAQIIFTTARKFDVKERTEEQLRELGFKDYRIIMELQNSKRIVINDFNNANPYPRAEAINIQRDTNELSRYL